MGILVWRGSGFGWPFCFGVFILRRLCCVVELVGLRKDPPPLFFLREGGMGGNFSEENGHRYEGIYSGLKNGPI